MAGKNFFLLAVIFLVLSRVMAYGDKVTIEHDTERSRESKKVVFLTGAVGFIGSNFLQYMFEKYPAYHFLVLDEMTYAANPDNISDEIKYSDRFEIWQGSVTNAELVNRLMARADYVVHFAAETHVARSIINPVPFFNTDVIGTHHMLYSLAKNPNRVQRFIHISTSEVYGSCVGSSVMDEEHPLLPRSPYAAAKAGADRLVYSYWCTYKIPAVIIRPFNNYGPRQHLEKLIPRFITHAIKRVPLTVHGDGSAQRDWIYVEDHCRALDAVLHTPDFDKIQHQVINIGSGRPTSVLEIAQAILAYFELPEDKYIQFIGDRPGQVACHVSSTAKAKEFLDWEPSISLEEGLKRTIDWYLKNQDSWKRQEWMQHVPLLAVNNVIEKH
jgi:dTDP-glucose 4,6-dehydratase